jgi:hypothetical protein
VNPESTAEPRWRAAGRTVLDVLIVCGGALAGQPPFTPAPDHSGPDHSAAEHESLFDTHEGDGAS